MGCTMQKHHGNKEIPLAILSGIDPYIHYSFGKMIFALVYACHVVQPEAIEFLMVK